jgi:heme-degrading monooxygenase HmoA
MSVPGFAETPEPPYYAVIFTSLRTKGDCGYGTMAERMVELARQQPGFLGVESVRGSDGFGITVSYWASEEAIANWKAHAEHRIAQDSGRRVWYADYQLRVARVERGYGRRAEPSAATEWRPSNNSNSDAPGGPPSVS